MASHPIEKIYVTAIIADHDNLAVVPLSNTTWKIKSHPIDVVLILLGRRVCPVFCSRSLEIGSPNPSRESHPKIVVGRLRALVPNNIERCQSSYRS
jgi:hypothetical protein